MSKFFIAFTKITGWPAQFFCFRTKVYYEDKKAQSRRIKGSAIVVSNHTALYDFAVLLFVFFGRIVRYQMAEVLFGKKGPLPKMLKMLGGIFVDRNAMNFGFVDESVEVLNHGGVVGIFPESRLPRPEEKRPLEFKSSAVYIAKISGAPIVPVFTNGSYFNKKRACVIIGKKFHVDEFWKDELSDKENLEKVTKKLREKIISLEKELKKQQAKEHKPFSYFWFDFAKITSAIPVFFFWQRVKTVYISEKAKEKQKKGVLYISNHTGFTDPVIMMTSIWYRRVHFVAMKELFEKKRIGFWLRKFHCISIDRENFNFSSFREISDRLNEGKACAIFPEGQIHTDASPVGTFKSGMILMAHKGNAPIVPLYINKRKKWYQRQIVAIGEPIDIRALCGAFPSMEKIEEVSSYLHDREMELVELSYRIRGGK